MNRQIKYQQPVARLIRKNDIINIYIFNEEVYDEMLITDKTASSFKEVIDILEGLLHDGYKKV